MTSSFNIGHIERSILAIPHTSYNMGSKGTGSTFDLPTQVTINVVTCTLQCKLIVNFFTPQMKEWLEGIVVKLHHVRNAQRQFISATCVVCCLHLCHINYSLKKKDYLFPLLKMLHVQPVTESRMCPEYTCLCDLLVQERFWYEL